MLSILVICVALLMVTICACEPHVRYVVVGAGPGGLQIAHYLESSHRDYVVIEKRGIPGSFFESQPRFRQLISINKRYSGRTELDHIMRHDWVRSKAHFFIQRPYFTKRSVLITEFSLV